MGRKVIVYKLDVTKEKDVNECFKKVKNVFGRIDILLNGAGVLGKIIYAVNENGDDRDYVMDINSKGVWFVR